MEQLEMPSGDNKIRNSTLQRLARHIQLQSNVGLSETLEESHGGYRYAFSA